MDRRKLDIFRLFLLERRARQGKGAKAPRHQRHQSASSRIRPHGGTLIPQRFTEANAVRTAPPDMENCSDLHLYADTEQCISAWRPTPEELVRINLGEPIWLWVVMGGNMPP